MRTLLTLFIGFTFLGSVCRSTPFEPHISESSNKPQVGESYHTVASPKTDNSAEKSVINLYLGCLGRKPTKEKLDLFTSGDFSWAQIVNIVCGSQEAREYSLKNAYISCLGREPDATEWVMLLNGEYSRVSVKEIKKQLCDHKYAKPLTIEKAYRDCLGRVPSEKELKHWIDKPMANQECYDAICDSKESKARLLQSWVSGDSKSHFDVGSGQKYDIWQDNCHSAAVRGLNRSLGVGIVVCYGQPESDVGGHTFNYETIASSTTYYNWGEACGPCDGPPQNVYHPVFPIPEKACHARCALQFCGSQYGNQTRVLAKGKRVQIPGPSSCYRNTYKSKGNRSDCRKCCTELTNRWDNDDADNRQNNTNGQDFRRACNFLCDANFK